MNMQILRLDYQANGRDTRMERALLLVGVCALLFVVWCYQEETEKITRQEVLMQGVQRASPTHTEVSPIRKDPEQVAQEVKQANAVILELNLPWKELFESFESAQNGDVAVLSIEPDAQKGLVRIGGEAKSLESLPAYLAHLQKVTLFRDVVLLNHQVQEQDPQRPVRFMLQATWGAQR